jgi:antitoxin FitA-like protein
MVARCYHVRMSVSLHVRDIPDRVHRVLAKRAKARGMSLRQYVIGVLTDHSSLPSVEEWLAEVEKLPSTRLRSSGAEAVRRSRVSDDSGVKRARRRR